jgi:hypothetical protein
VLRVFYIKRNFGGNSIVGKFCKEIAAYQTLKMKALRFFETSS